ncbi:MAG: hypothetical protein EOO02_14600 [Chitinophagaceae bacterium]|nr:MAG: hypothetical protein EOO02_14600 [Chitinophagaceae bacterium]
MKYIILFIAALSLSSCSKDSGGFDQHTVAPLSIEFDNIVGGKNLILNAESYTNKTGETFNISLLQYYISNIKLTAENGTEYTVPQDSSYFLIKESDLDSRFAKISVPENDYTKLSFVLGVDSLRSTMDISKRGGVLDPAGGMDDGMYWGWNSGYIFFKFEGISDKAPTDPSGQNKFRYHIGGFGGYSAPTVNNLRTINIDLVEGGIARARATRASNIHLMVDLSKFFDGSGTLSIEANPTVMFSQYSLNLSANFQGMFRHDHTEN